MQKLISLFLLLLCFSFSLGKESTNIKYVWATSGLIMRTSPSINGKIIKTLAFGDSVLVLESTNVRHVVEFMKSLDSRTQSIQLEGTWVKIISGEDEGYVLDAYLLKAPCPHPDERVNNYSLRMAEKYSSSELDANFTVYHNENPGLMRFEGFVSNIPGDFQLSFSPIKIDSTNSSENTLIDRYESFGESFYFKGFSLQEILLFIKPFYLDKRENSFKVYERDQKHIRMTDQSTQTIDMWFYEDDITVLSFEDAGC